MLIGEVAARSGVSARMLRHYDAIGLVQPTGRTRGGYREYCEDDVRRLFHVEGLRSLGLSLREVSQTLADLSFNPAAIVEALMRRSRERLQREEELLRLLGQVRASEPEAWWDVLHTVELLRALGTGGPSARQRLALSSIGREERDAVLLAEAALDEADPGAAGALHWALARAGDGAVPVLEAALDSTDPQRRHRAVAALTKIGTPSATAVLADAHHHHDPLVRARAVLVRGAQGDLECVPALVALIVEGRDDVEAADVLALLARQGDEDEVVAAVVAALPEPADAPRRRLTAALTEMPGPAARAALESLLDDADRGVALMAKAALAGVPAQRR